MSISARRLQSTANTALLAAPSGNLPGWNFVGVQHFDIDADFGQVMATYPDMDAYDGYNDTSGNGRYSTSKTLTVHDSVLDCYVHTESGTHYVCAMMPITGWSGQTGGRYSVRVRTDVVAGYKIAFLLWPVNDDWNKGEVDFPEAALGGSPKGYVHTIGNPSANSSQINTAADLEDWHVYTIEWTAGVRLTFYVDGVRVGTTTNSVPTGGALGGTDPKFRWILQVETQLSGGAPDDSAAGHVLIDWAAQWQQASP